MTQKIIRQCTRGIVVEKKNSQLLFTFEQKVACPELFIPFANSLWKKSKVPYLSKLSELF